MPILLWDEYPDIEPRRPIYRSRCPECWQSMGCAPGCPNEEIESESTKDEVEHA